MEYRSFHYTLVLVFLHVNFAVSLYDFVCQVLDCVVVALLGKGSTSVNWLYLVIPVAASHFNTMSCFLKRLGVHTFQIVWTHSDAFVAHFCCFQVDKKISALFPSPSPPVILEACLPPLPCVWHKNREGMSSHYLQLAGSTRRFKWLKRDLPVVFQGPLVGIASRYKSLSQKYQSFHLFSFITLILDNFIVVN